MLEDYTWYYRGKHEDWPSRMETWELCSPSDLHVFCARRYDPEWAQKHNLSMFQWLRRHHPDAPDFDVFNKICIDDADLARFLFEGLSDKGVVKISMETARAIRDYSGFEKLGRDAIVGFIEGFDLDMVQMLKSGGLSR